MRDRSLTFQARSLYAYLLTAQGEIPSQKAIAMETGCALSVVAKYLRELEEKGWIKRSRIRNQRALRTRYEFKREMP
jgi:DNA-binding MarR family transcriptional regulator